MNRRVGRLPFPLRVLVFVLGLLLAFFAALAVGAVVALLVSGDDARTATGSAVTSPAPKTSPTTTPEATTDEDEDPAVVASFVHLATDANSRGDYTYLSDPSVDGDPDAIVLVESAPDEGTADDGAYDHNIGVWFEPQKQKWAVFNQDIRPVPAGTAYRVIVPRASDGFVHRFSEPKDPDSASASASVSASAGSAPEPNDTYLDDPLVNGKPEARLSVTQNWNPGGGEGVYNDHPVGVRYDEGRGRWVIFNQDLAPIKDGAAFNVSISESDTGS